MTSIGRDRWLLEQLLIELLWRRCAADPAFFFETCLSIPSQRDPRGREEFELFDYQHDDLRTFLTNRFVTVLKCRQIGISTLVGAYALWRCLFRPGSVILWISDGQDNANKAVGMLNVMWTYLPQWVRDRAPRLTGDQAGKKEWTFADGMTSRIRAFAGTGKAGASETASLVVLDEFALVEDQDNLLRSADPTTDAGGSLWIISTARGGHNKFAETYRRAKRGASKFVSIFHPWMVSRFVNPKAGLMVGCGECGGTGKVGDGYCSRCVDESTYEVKRREFADKPWLFHAEYPADEEEAFRESGRPVFTALPALEDCDTAWVRGELVEQDGRVVFVADDDGPLRLHETVVGGCDDWRDHVLFVDPSQGVGGDATAGTVLCYDDDAIPDRVAWWHSNVIEPVDAAVSFNLLGRFFEGPRGPALLAVESTGGWGDSMLVELDRHLRYPRLYAHRATGHRRRPRADKLGFPMHATRRPLVIDRIMQYVSTDRPDMLLGGIDPLLRYELGTFVRREDGKLAADTGCHDDLVMSTAAALWLLVEEVSATAPSDGEKPREKPTAVNTLTGMFDKIEEVRRMEAQANAKQARRNRRSFERRNRPIRVGGRRR